MENFIGNNINALRIHKGLSQEQMAEAAGVSQTTISAWECGASTPRKSNVYKLIEAIPGIDFDDIMSEENGFSARVFENNVSKKPRGAIPVAAMDMVPVPLRGRVHAGPFTYPENLEAREETAMAPKRLVEEDPDLYACEVEGDCMSKVYPEDNCIIFVSPNKRPHNGSIAVVTLDGCDALVRRMYKTANTLVLSPESWNPEHKDIIITSDSDHTVEFGGKVVWFQASKEME